jgi:hypothetical protein
MKKTAILLVVLVALVGFAFFYKKVTDERTSGYSLSKADAREYLLSGVPSDKIRKIVIQDPKGKVTLAVSGNQWVVEERSGHPAALQKIEHAVQALEDVKIKDRKEVGKSALAKLKVLSPTDAQAGEGAGLEVQLQDEKGAVLGSVVVGSSPKASGGASSGNMFGGPTPQRFVRTPNDKDTVWVVDDSFDEFQVDAKGWIDTAWPIITGVKSVEVIFPNAADSWKAERKEKDTPFTFVNAPAGEELDTAKASGLDGRVLEGPPSDVLPKDKVTPDTMKGAIKARLVTFDGFTYDVELLEQKKAGEEGSAPGYLLTFKVSADLPKERKPGPDEKEEDKKRLDEAFKKHGEGLAAQLAAEQKQQGWVYEVSEYGVSALVKKRSELVRDASSAPAEPAPGPDVPGALPAPTVAPRPPRPLSIPPASIARPQPAPASAEAPAPSPSAEKPAETKPAPAESKPAEVKPDAPAAPVPAPAKPDAAPAEKPAETKPAAEEKPAAPAPAPAPSEKPAETPAPAPAPSTEKPAEPKPASS